MSGGWGIVIKSELVRQNISQAQMARDLGVSQRHLSYIVQGKSDPSMGLLGLMMAYLGLRIAIQRTYAAADVVHGRVSTYRDSDCRCGPCYRANRNNELQKARRAEKKAAAE